MIRITTLSSRSSTKSSTDAVDKHKKWIQSRIDNANKKLKPGPMDHDADGNLTESGKAKQNSFNQIMQNIERDDYAGMKRINDSYVKQSRMLGKKVDATPPEPWNRASCLQIRGQRVARRSQ
jgi:hypothetical protein